MNLSDLLLLNSLTRNLPTGQSGSEALFCEAGEPRQSPFHTPNSRIVEPCSGRFSFHIEFDQLAPSVCHARARPIYPRSRRGPRGSDTAIERHCPGAYSGKFKKSGLASTRLIQTNIYYSTRFLATVSVAVDRKCSFAATITFSVS